MSWKTTPTKIVYAHGLSDTMARVFPHTGVIQLNADKWHTLPKPQQDMILLHEIGHLKRKTANEFEADAYAFQTYMQQGGSPKQALLSLTENLPFTNKEHLARVRAQFLRSVEYDATHNNNPKAKALMSSAIYKTACKGVPLWSHLNHTGTAANKKTMAFTMDPGLAGLIGNVVTQVGTMAGNGTFDNENIKIAKANAAASYQAAQQRAEDAKARQLEAQNRGIELANAETRRIENASANAQARLNTAAPAADGTTTTPKTDGMPIWGWVLIGIGTLAVLGTGAYFAFFKK